MAFGSLLILALALLLALNWVAASNGAGAARGAAIPSKPSATPGAGTRANPVPLGQGYLFQRGGRAYMFGVVESLTGSEATEMAREASLLNARPPAGHHYILVFAALVYGEGPDDGPFYLSDSNVKFYADNQFWEAPSLSTAPQPKFGGRRVFPGAVVNGWLLPRYLPSHLHERALLVYDDAYFALR